MSKRKPKHQSASKNIKAQAKTSGHELKCQGVSQASECDPKRQCAEVQIVNILSIQPFESSRVQFESKV